jgi:hypothetical protein
MDIDQYGTPDGVTGNHPLSELQRPQSEGN